MKRNYLYTNAEFAEKANIIHNNKYDYSKVEYLGAHKKVIIICPEHKEFQQIPTNHLSGKGCRKCGIKNGTNTKYSDTTSFIEKAIKIHGDKYDYSYVKYENCRKKIFIFCRKHNKIFEQNPNNHLSGFGCQACSKNMSKMEIRWLNNCNLPNDKEHRQVSIKIGKRKFKVDGFDPITNTIYEFYGDYWHGNPKFYKPEEINLGSKKKFGELYQNTINREYLLKSANYKLITIWESDFLNSTPY